MGCAEGGERGKLRVAGKYKKYSATFYGLLRSILIFTGKIRLSVDLGH